ncbi:hypothetical protein BROUX41_004751 [Berkeleyomyces rouxiae]
MPASNITAIAAAAMAVSAPFDSSPLLPRPQPSTSALRSQIPHPLPQSHPHSPSRPLPNLSPTLNRPSSSDPQSSSRIPSLRPGVAPISSLLLTPTSTVSSSFTLAPLRDLTPTTTPAAPATTQTIPSTTTTTAAIARAPTHKYPASPSPGPPTPTPTSTKPGPALPSPYKSRRLSPTASHSKFATNDRVLENTTQAPSSSPQLTADFTASHKYPLVDTTHFRAINRVDSAAPMHASSLTQLAHAASPTSPARTPQSHSRSHSYSQSTGYTAPSDDIEGPQSQLLQLSHFAALQHKMAETTVVTPTATAAPSDPIISASRKRAADGSVKHDISSARRLGHSRNTSSVSVSSASGTKIGELSAELRTRLSYAMMKVNHGWQFYSIDEVESLASKAVSPSSTSSTHIRRSGSSTSPGLSSTDKSVADLITPASLETRSQQSPISSKTYSTESSNTNDNGLAPPASIQSSRSNAQKHTRHNSRPAYTPTLLSHSRSMLPQTPGPSTTYRRLSCSQLGSDGAMVFSPHQNVREQDAIESLLFMSSPGNPANLKSTYAGPLTSPQTSGLRQFPPSSSAPAGTTSQQRRSLPGSQPRKTLPSHRPTAAKRVDSDGNSYEDSEQNVDLCSPPLGGTRGVPRRRVDLKGAYVSGTDHGKLHLTLPSALDAPIGNHIRLADEDIDRMLERVAAEESEDDDDEIQIPRRIMTAPHVQAV